MAETSLKAVSPDSDGDFEFQADTAEDDERTIEEEEQQQSRDSFTNELNDLQEEADIPVADLIAMYYQDGGPPGGPVDDADDTDDSTGEILSNNDLSLDKEEVARDLLPGDSKQSSPNKTPGEGVNGEEGSSLGHSTHRLLRSSAAGPDDESDMDSEDSEYVPLDEWKKDIKVGKDFQADIPSGIRPYDDGPVYENEDALLWDPSRLEDEEVESFLRQVQIPNHATQEASTAPVGVHVRDDEKALYILLQCGHSVEEALRRHRMQIVPPSDEMSLWSEEECRNFESGLRSYGKNFYLIHKHKVRTRAVGELVHFYYLWKKTERHDAFSQVTRLSKKKYHVHPGVTHYMEKFLDDSESVLSPTPAQSMLDRNRLMNKPTVLPPPIDTGSMDIQNSPEVGGVIASDLPREMSQSEGCPPRLPPVTEGGPAANDGTGMEPPAKRSKLDREVEAEIFKSLDSLAAIPDLLEAGGHMTQELIAAATAAHGHLGERVLMVSQHPPVRIRGAGLQSSTENAIAGLAWNS